MIEVTRLNGLPLTLNAELIKFVEATPDTLISLTTGEKIMVKEAVELITQRVLDYRMQCCSCAGEGRRSSGSAAEPKSGGPVGPPLRRRVEESEEAG
jgi:flagellar protein FlbD